MATSEDDDRLLAGWLDGELGAAERSALEARLAAEPALRERLEALRHAGADIRGAFDALLTAAPRDRLHAGLERAFAPPAPAPARRVSPALGRIAAAAAIAILGVMAGRWSSAPADDNWRASVADYMTLYTSDSFGAAPSPRLAEELAVLSQKLGAPLDAERLQLEGLSLRRAESLQYEGAPLGQIGYVDGATPVAFCVTRDGEADAPLAASAREGFAIASWAKGGRGFMLIGKIPAARLESFARQLQQSAG